MAQIKKHYAWIGPSNGWAAMNWTTDDAGYYDWVGLYPIQGAGVDDYITYQWVSNGSSYVSKKAITNGLGVRYFTWVDTGGQGDTAADSSIKLNRDETNASGERTVTPALVLASLGGFYTELMRSRSLNLDAQVNVVGEHNDNPGCWVRPNDRGYAELHWTTPSDQAKGDWVALYSDVHKANDDYISGAWQWAVGHFLYATGSSFEPGMQARYIKEGKPYIALRRSIPVANGYVDLSNIYTSSSSVEVDNIDDACVADVAKVIRIMVDQLNKAILLEPSVFSPGIWPYGENLLFKNLSSNEVGVIGAALRPSQYYDVLMIYYETYKLAIQIADDGERNAKRHAFWQISLFKKFGKDFAVKLGDAHEAGRPGTAEDNDVDAKNNAAALKYAEEHPDVDPTTAA